MARPSQTVLALTAGDPAGIGLDITIKAWSERRQRRIPPFVAYADHDSLRERASLLGVALASEAVDTPADASAMFERALPVVNVPLVEACVAGRPDSANGHAVIRSIEAAARAVIDGRAAALVTNPIAKHVLYDAGFTHPGHTEFLAELADRYGGGGPYTSVMMLAADELRVVPLTIHVPLSAVPALITVAHITRTARTLVEALERDYGIGRPRIAVAGLNPHAGENGSIGREDTDVIAPAVASLAAAGMSITGPHSADTLFHAEARARYDAVIAMYHDQALIPLKTLAFDRGVNITLGLPFVRTSPDHGTAFDIAGTGKASCESLITALHEAARMAAGRRGAARAS